MSRKMRNFLAAALASGAMASTFVCPVFAASKCKGSFDVYVYPVFLDENNDPQISSDNRAVLTYECTTQESHKHQIPKADMHPDNVFSEDTTDGYEWIGWDNQQTKKYLQNPRQQTYSADTDEIYEDGGSFTTVYMVFKASEETHSYTVTYNADGVEGYPQTETASGNNVELDYTIAAAPQSAEGEFEGWKDAEGNVYQPGQAVKLTSDLVLNASFKSENKKEAHPSIENTADKDSVDSGGTVNFTVKSNVPDNLKNYLRPYDTSTGQYLDYEGRGSYALDITDEYNPKFTPNEGMSVSVNGKTLDPSLYTVSNSENGFKVSMDLVKIYEDGSYFTMDEIASTPEIRVDWSAKLKTMQPGTFQTNAKVSYPAGESEKAATNTQVYGIKIQVTDSATGAPIDNMNYMLCSDPEGEDCIMTAIGDSDGYTVFDGLAAGTYYLIEDGAPEGYPADTRAKEIVLSEETVSKKTGDTDYNRLITAVVKANLPFTGGLGKQTALIAGSALFALTAAGYAVSEYKSKKKKS